jgi:hypothetical protein
VPDANRLQQAARIGPTPVDPAAVRASFDRVSEIFVGMMVTVADLSTRRCPYKDRTNHCTAKFGCRNQRRPTEPTGLRVCDGDDELDYRSAWEAP